MVLKFMGLEDRELATELREEGERDIPFILFPNNYHYANGKTMMNSLCKINEEYHWQRSL